MNLKSRVKICGITSPEQALLIAQAGADAIGLVFYEPSPRSVMDLSLAAEIANAVGPFVSVVGLFVDADSAAIESVLNRVPLNCIQFHGNESAEFCSSFHRPFIKAVRMKPSVALNDVMVTYQQAQGILLDAYVKGIPGGTGEAFNWSLVPKNSQIPIVLAGGLTPDNVRTAITTTSPYGVDVSGGVEVSPGIKDLNKVHAFIRSAKSE